MNVAICGWNYDSILWSLLASALIAIAIIDYRTMLIPGGLDAFIFILGLIHLLLHLDNWSYYVIGFVSMAVFLFGIAVCFKKITGKSGLGYGDIELMACVGLCIGWGHALFALVIASVLASIVESIRIVVTGKNDKFALGPYLALGAIIAACIGDKFFAFYMQVLL